MLASVLETDVRWECEGQEWDNPERAELIDKPVVTTSDRQAPEFQLVLIVLMWPWNSCLGSCWLCRR